MDKLEYRLTLRKAGQVGWIFGFLKAQSATLRGGIFEVEEITKDGDAVHLDLLIDIDQLVTVALQRLMDQTGDRILARQNIAIEIQRRIDQRKKKRSARREKRVSKKTAAKKT